MRGGLFYTLLAFFDPLAVGCDVVFAPSDKTIAENSNSSTSEATIKVVNSTMWQNSEHVQVQAGKPDQVSCAKTPPAQRWWAVEQTGKKVGQASLSITRWGKLPRDGG